MSFVIQGEIHLDAKGAIQGVTVSKAQIESLGKAGKRAGTELAQIGPKVAGAGRSAQVAAGQVGNLAAQWNDVIVMMAAGQNPLQLAMQQGSQITQVIGPMGAAGAVQALKTSFLSLINPISLVTYAVIAGGAAMVGALSSSREEAESLVDRMEGAQAAVEAFEKAAAQAALSGAEMVAEFGTADPVLKAVLADLAALKKLETYKEIDATADSVRNLVLDLKFWDERSGASASQDFLGLRGIRSAAREAGAEFQRNLEILSRSEDPATKLEAALDLKNQINEVTGGLDGMNAKQQEFYLMLSTVARDLDIMGVRVREAEEAQSGQNERMRQGLQLAGMMRQQWADRAAFVAQETAELEKSGRMQRLIAAWGEDSVVVTRARLQAERDAYAEIVKSEVGVNAMADGLMAVWDWANRVAEVDAEGNIIAAEAATWSWADAMGGVAAQIQAIVGALASIGGGMITNAAKSAELGALKAGKSVQEAAVARQRTIREAEWQAREGAAGGGVSGWLTRQRIGIERYQFEEGVGLDAQIIEARRSARSSGGGSGRAAGRNGAARAAEREAQALDGLILRLQDELDTTRETDPVKKEMLRYRDQLAGATDEERRAVESLIAARIREEEALERQQEMWGFWSQFASTAIRDVDDALNMLLDSLLEASLTGGGPLGWIFGGQDSSGKGGLLGAVFGALFPKMATGGEVGEGAAGLILGQGGGRDDRQLILTSPGEYIVNARATARHRALLDQINYGTPGFAMGGAVSPSRSAMAPPPGRAPGERTYNINVTGTGSEEIHRAVKMGIEASFEHYDRNILAGRVRTIVNDKWSS